jgi:outer membrane immunogenic protein
MNKFLIATAMLAALASGGIASAADLNLEVKAPPRYCGGGAFQGIYVGIHGGGVIHTANRVDRDDFLGGGFAPMTHVLSATSGIIGAQAGYNYQCDNAVFGIEVDGSWMNATRSSRLFPNLGPPEAAVTTKLEALATARARAGVVAADRFLLYVTGGVAMVRSLTTWSVTFGIPGVDESFPFQERNWGWVAGFGAEWALSQRLSLRSEVLYVGLPDRDYTFASALLGELATVTHSDSIWVARVGANVRLTKD